MAVLLFLIVLATEVLFVPAITAQKAQQSAWLAGLLPAPFGLASLALVWKLGQYFPGQTLPQYSERILGKIAGKLASTSFAIFLLIGAIIIVREFAELLTIMFMPETPVLVFSALIVLVAGYGSGKGIEVVARASQFVLPLFVLSLTLVVLLSVPDMELGKLKPWLEGGIMPVIKASMAPASWYGEVVLLAVLLPSVNKPREMWKKGSLVLLIAAAVFTLVISSTLMVFGPELTGYLFFPVLEMARYVHIARYVQRMELLVMAFWFVGIVIKTAAFYYAASLTCAQTLGLKEYKPVIYPVGLALVLGATFMFGNSLEFMGILDKIWTPIALMFELGLPLLLWLVALMRPGIRRRAK